MEMVNCTRNDVMKDFKMTSMDFDCCVSSDGFLSGHDKLLSWAISPKTNTLEMSKA